MITVLIVDDSATMRAMIRAALAEDPDLRVVGEAADAFEAREAVRALNPDVMTLDVEMPRMSGLEFLERIMRLHPMPVVMVSTRTARGADAALEALELGAVDCVAKPAVGRAGAFEGLAAKVKNAAGARVRTRCRFEAAASRTHVSEDYLSDGSVVAIGASTGGVEALLTVLGGFPAQCPPTVVTQHMPAMFTRSFADRLDRQCRPTVSEAREGSILENGHVYIAPGDRHLEVVGFPGRLRCRLSDGRSVNGHRPSVDVLFQSVAKRAGARCVGVILTGMGRDGAMGLAEIRAKGARTFGQDEASCIVYGMPKAAFEAGAVERQAPLDRLSKLILNATNRRRSAGPSPENA